MHSFHSYICMKKEIAGGDRYNDFYCGFGFMVLNATFNKISVISWRKICKSTIFKLFGCPIFRSSAYLMQVITETNHTCKTEYLRYQMNFYVICRFANFPPRYDWNFVESGVKDHKPKTAIEVIISITSVTYTRERIILVLIIIKLSKKCRFEYQRSF
jgi:hypothetical protein